MFALRSPLVRIGITLVLLGLLGVSVLLIKNIVTAAWQDDRQEEALYQRSPGCFPRRDPSEVNANLPSDGAVPCGRLLIVSRSQGGVWVTRYYDRDHLPATVQQMLRLMGPEWRLHDPNAVLL